MSDQTPPDDGPVRAAIEPIEIQEEMEASFLDYAMSVITTRALPDGSKDAADMTAAATARKIDWVREAAGDRFARIELNTICPTVEIADDRRAAAERIAADLPVSAAEVLDSPAVLLGTVDQIVETLKERRERYGFSYIVILEPVMEAFAPVVARLAGR